MPEFVTALILVFAIGMLIRWAIRKRNKKSSRALCPLPQQPARLLVNVLLFVHNAGRLPAPTLLSAPIAGQN